MVLNKEHINDVIGATYHKTDLFYFEFKNIYRDFWTHLKTLSDDEAIKYIAGFAEEMARIGKKEGLSTASERLTKIIKG